MTSAALPGGALTVTTTRQGDYRFTGLEPGIYALRVELAGFTTYEETDLRALAATTTEHVDAIVVDGDVLAKPQARGRSSR